MEHWNCRKTLSFGKLLNSEFLISTYDVIAIVTFILLILFCMDFRKEHYQ